MNPFSAIHVGLPYLPRGRYPKGMNDSKREKATLTTAIISLLLALAGNADWFKPRDDTATKAVYDKTKGEITRLAEDMNRNFAYVDEDLERLEERQERFEAWVEKSLSRLEEAPRPGDRLAFEPPPAPPPKTKKAESMTESAQKPVLPEFDELAK